MKEPDLTKAGALELIEELCKRGSGVLEVALHELLLQNKINFSTISKQYVKALEYQNKDKLNQLVEAETCTMESLIYNKKNEKQVQRCLYLLNKSNRFNMHDLNIKHGYNEEIAKHLSWYYRNKNGE